MADRVGLRAIVCGGCLPGLAGWALANEPAEVAVGSPHRLADVAVCCRSRSVDPSSRPDLSLHRLLPLLLSRLFRPSLGCPSSGSRFVGFVLVLIGGWEQHFGGLEDLAATSSCIFTPKSRKWRRNTSRKSQATGSFHFLFIPTRSPGPVAAAAPHAGAGLAPSAGPLHYGRKWLLVAMFAAAAGLPLVGPGPRAAGS